MKFGSLFTGFGGADIGAMSAGFTPVWGVEYDAQIAAVANANLGGHVRVADLLDCDPQDFAPVDLLHASPPCPNFSVAKAGREETAHDIALADKVSEFIRVLHPRFVTVENVPQYVRADSYRRILNALADMGYMYGVQALNAANFGVPQTRRRLIVRAVYGAFPPPLPRPVKWVGWYEAIEDLLPTLPETQFAEWQLKRLPAEMNASILIEGRNPNGGADKWQHEPAQTLTLTHPPRALIIGGANTSDTQAAAGVGVSSNDEPTRCVASNGSQWRAWLGAGRVVSMTPRALARFQSFPDWYQLPDKKALACKGIGNAVPPLMYQRVAEGMAAA